MKKITIISIMSFIFFTIACIVANILPYIPIDKVITSFNDALSPLFIGIIILTFSGLIAIFIRKVTWLNIVYFILNAIAFGFCTTSWYIFKGFETPSFLIMLTPLACVAYILIFFALAHIPFFSKHLKALFWWLYTFTIVISFIFIIACNSEFLSVLGFYLFVDLGFIQALCVRTKTLKALIRKITVYSYSVYFVAIIILIAILSDGDGVDVINIDHSLDLNDNYHVHRVARSSDNSVKKKHFKYSGRLYLEFSII